ncbi:MAG TPA: DUF808 domain-containing protein [Acetobacteraceae bacterium]
MSTGLIALLDDVAGLAKVAAATLDDAAGQAARAGAKAAGVVIDDAAVTPTYVTGFAPSRELPIVGKIALGSLKNKLLYLLPAALLLSLMAPWAITPLLMAGGVYLCFEGAEKILHALRPHRDAHAAATPVDARMFEDQKVRSAIQTDLILSAEIMAITLGAVPDSAFAVQAAVLAVVGTGITGLVYGGVALIVKADDAGLAMSRTGWPPVRAVGRGLVVGMPPFLRVLSVVGTAAMIWVGGGILLHGLEMLGLPGPAHAAHALAAAAAGMVPAGQAVIEWLVGATVSGVVGLAVGAAAIPVAQRVVAPLLRLVRR